MIRMLLLAIAYLIPALLLEVAILPQAQLLLPDDSQTLLQPRLLALGAILIGLLRGELPGMLMGLAGALLAGFALRPDRLGATVIGFVLVGYLAGQLARHFILTGWLFRAFVIFFLLLVERLAFNATMWFFWRNVELSLPWSTLIWTALAGTMLYRLLLRIKRPLYMMEAEEELALGRSSS